MSTLRFIPECPPYDLRGVYRRFVTKSPIRRSQHVPANSAQVPLLQQLVAMAIFNDEWPLGSSNAICLRCRQSCPSPHYLAISARDIVPSCEGCAQTSADHGSTSANSTFPSFRSRTRARIGLLEPSLAHRWARNVLPAIRPSSQHRAGLPFTGGARITISSSPPAGWFHTM